MLSYFVIFVHFPFLEVGNDDCTDDDDDGENFERRKNCQTSDDYQNGEKGLWLLNDRWPVTHGDVSSL